ncbi:glycosyltransferase family 1 protein [Guyparkeria sp. 1SP6A2]|nr:glycosyltransferase family 1 protein [Guyparkeria sp. 1SP6A2]
MDISLVTETYPPDVNGVSNTLERLVAALRQRGHRVSVTCPRARARHGLEDGIEVSGLALPFYSQVRIGLPRRRAFLEQWREDPPDLVHIATEGPLGASALSAARALDLPVTSSLHTNFHRYARSYRVGWLAMPAMRYLRRFHNRTAATFIPTHEQAEELTPLGFERLAVLGRGVDTQLFHPGRRDERLRHAWGVQADEPVLLHVGRLAAEKNLDLLVAAMERARRINPATRLVVVGDGPERRHLEAVLPEAVFAGVRRGEDLAAHYASADGFVFPSQTETFGNVVLEAMASGLPCLAFDYAAGRLLIEPGLNGLLATPGDADGFLDRVPHLLTADAPALGVRARATALGHGWAKVVDVFEARLLSVAGPSRSARRSPAQEEPA